MKEKKLVVSTNNENKLREIKEILKDLPIEVLSKKDLGLADLEVKEDGETLLENSGKKARELSRYTDYMVLADDSGLFVDELDGKPGVHSSRYAGEDGNDAKNNAKLLEKMKAFPLEKRKASFKALITIVTEEKEEVNILGECRGHIDFEEKGPRSFGYDPLFIPEGYDENFAQMDIKIKNKISHRAKALEGVREYLKDELKGENNENPTSK